MIHKELKSKADKAVKESRKKLGTAVANTIRAAIPVAIWFSGSVFLGSLIEPDRIPEMLVALVFVTWLLAPVYLAWRWVSPRVPRIKPEKSVALDQEEAPKFRMVA